MKNIIVMVCLFIKFYFTFVYNRGVNSQLNIEIKISELLIDHKKKD